MNGRILAIAGLAFLGMIDTLYLSIKRGQGAIPCRLTGGCNDVLTSAYSEVAGIPISWVGLAFYLTIFSFAIFALFGAKQLMPWIFWSALSAFGVSLVLTFIQAFVLEAFCEYCLASALFVTSILVLSAWPGRRIAPQATQDAYTPRRTS